MITPAGPLSSALDGLRTLIANVPAFQAMTGTANASDAAKRVFIGEFGYPIVSVAVAANVLSVVTREPTLINVADVVTLEGAAVGAQSLGLDGQYTVTAASGSTFTAAIVAADLVVTTVDNAFVVPCPRPLAVISEASSGLNSKSIGTGGTVIYAGAIEILLENDVPAEYANDPTNALYGAKNDFGNFLQGLSETQDTGDLMVLNSIETSVDAEFTAKPEQDDNTVRFERWRGVIKVAWGLDG